MAARGAGSRPPRARGYVLLGVVLTLLMAAAIAVQMGRESALSVDGADAETQTLRARYVAESGLAWAAARLNAGGACAAIPAGTPITGTVDGDAFSVASTTVSTNPLTVRLTSTPTLATPAGSVAYAPLTRQVLLYTRAEVQTTVVRAFAPTPATVADATIANQMTGVSSANAANVGAEPTLVLDNKDKMAHPLLRFDLANALPPGGKLKAATLVLTPQTPWDNSGETSDITVHEITGAWAEGSGKVAAPLTISSGATWNQRQPGVAWGYVPYLAPATVNRGRGNALGAGGGDYDPAHVALFNVQSGALPATLSWDVTPLAAQWLANPAANFGLLLKSEETLTQAVFFSSESPVRARRPRLVLSSLLPCGGPLVALSTVDVGTGQPVVVATVDTPVLLRVAITNGAATAAVPSSGFSIVLPAGVTVASSPLAATSGCGAMSLSATAGASSVSASGGSIAAASGATPGVCTLSFAISGATASGTATLTTGPQGTPSRITVAAGTVATSVGANAAAGSTDLWIVPQPVPEADTFLDEDYKGDDFGSSSWLRLRYDHERRLLLRFAGLPPAGAAVQSATLRLYLRSVDDPYYFSVLRIQPALLRGAWSESTATWDDPGANSKGAKDSLASPALPLYTVPSKSQQWLALDVAAAVDAWAAGTVANNGLVLASTSYAPRSMDELTFDSAERAGGNPPQLRITY